MAQEGKDTNQASAVEEEYEPPQKCKKKTVSHPKKQKMQKPYEKPKRAATKGGVITENTGEQSRSKMRLPRTTKKVATLQMRYVAEEESDTESAESQGNEPPAKKRKSTVADNGKGKKIPKDDGSEEKSDSNEQWGAKFTSKAVYDDYKLIEKKKHISEQPINVKACEHKFPAITKNMLSERKWHRLTQQMGKANLTVVREFYANYKHAKGDIVRIRGVDVDVSEQELNKFLETPSESKVEFQNILNAPNYEDIRKKLCGETFKVWWQGNYNTSSREHMLEQPRTWLNWICSRLIQGTHKSKATKDRVLLLYALDTGVPLDVAHLMHQQMRRCLSNQQRSLYYPNTFTAYLKKCKVKWEKEDEWEEKDPPELDITCVRGPKKGRNAALEERLDNLETGMQALREMILTRWDTQDKTVAEILDLVRGMAPSSPRAQQLMEAPPALVITGGCAPKKEGDAAIEERHDNPESETQAPHAQQLMEAPPVLDNSGVRDPKKGGNAAFDNHKSEMQVLGETQQLTNTLDRQDKTIKFDIRGDGSAHAMPRASPRLSTDLPMTDRTAAEAVCGMTYIETDLHGNLLFPTDLVMRLPGEEAVSDATMLDTSGQTSTWDQLHLGLGLSK